MLEVCFEAWDSQPSGYIFLCTKQNKTWRDFPFHYPKQVNEIKEKFEELQRSDDTDIYWSLLTFSRPKRKEEYAQSSPVLFADLDEVKPQDVTPRPSVAWASSKNRYQCLWYMDNTTDGLSGEEFKKLNRGLTYYNGADKGGWDLTQVLRIPGTMNYKYSPPQQGKLLWDDCTTYRRTELERISNKAPVAPSVDAGASFTALLSKHRARIPARISRMLQYPESRVAVGKRSEVLWSLEAELVKAKIPLEDIVALISGSAWNKYRGRHDELKRITTEINKVYQESIGAVCRDDSTGNATDVTSSENEVDDELEPTTLPIVGFSTFMGGVSSRPGWMIRDIWLRRSHGIIAGDPKTFKSTVALDIAVSVASGKRLWNKYNVEDRGPVLIIQNENSDWIVRDRVEKIMASKGLVGKVEWETVGRGRDHRNEDYSSFRRADVTFAPELPIAFLNNYGFSFNDPLHIEQIEEVMEEIRPALVMFDPLYLMFDGEMNSAKELNPTLQWLLGIKNRFNTSVMLIHHWNKNGMASRGGQRMLGSVALHGWTESGLFLQAKEAKSSSVSIVNGGGDSKASDVGQLIMEREFRAAGIMPKLALEIGMSNDAYSCKLCELDKEITIGDRILEILLAEGEKSIRQLAESLVVSRRVVERIVSDEPTFELIPGKSGQPTKVRICN